MVPNIAQYAQHRHFARYEKLSARRAEITKELDQMSPAARARAESLYKELVNIQRQQVGILDAFKEGIDPKKLVEEKKLLSDAVAFYRRVKSFEAPKIQPGEKILSPARPARVKYGRSPAGLVARPAEGSDVAGVASAFIGRIKSEGIEVPNKRIVIDTQQHSSLTERPDEITARRLQTLADEHGIKIAVRGKDATGPYTIEYEPKAEVRRQMAQGRLAAKPADGGGAARVACPFPKIQKRVDEIMSRVPTDRQAEARAAMEAAFKAVPDGANDGVIGKTLGPALKALEAQFAVAMQAHLREAASAAAHAGKISDIKADLRTRGVLTSDIEAKLDAFVERYGDDARARVEQELQSAGGQGDEQRDIRAHNMLMGLLYEIGRRTEVARMRGIDPGQIPRAKVKVRYHGVKITERGWELHEKASEALVDVPEAGGDHVYEGASLKTPIFKVVILSFSEGSR